MKRKKAPARIPTDTPLALAISDQPNPISEATADGKSATPHAAERPSDLKRSAVPSILFEGDDVKSSEPVDAPQKFSTGSVSATTLAPAETLPESYGTGKLTLTARDPHCLHAQWDISTQQLDRYPGLSSVTQLTLRVHQESLSGPLLSQVQVKPGIHSSFLPVEAPDAQRFVADLGYSSEQGGWKTVATGETLAIHLPASPVEHIRFATLPFAAKPGETSPGTVSVHPSTPGASRSEQSLIAEGFPLPTRSFAHLAEGAAGETFVEKNSPPVITARAPAFGPEWVGDAEGILEEWDESGEIPIVVATGAEMKWTEAQQKALSEIIGWSLLRGKSYSSIEVTELLQGTRQGEIPGKPMENLPSVANVELSSAGLAGVPVPEEHGFWFNVNAELVIYGATESNASVTVGGRPIALRSDGTFSCRFALPDGNYPLALAAKSIRSEVRQADLRFSRETSYSEGTSVQPPSKELKRPGEAF